MRAKSISFFLLISFFLSLPALAENSDESIRLHLTVLPSIASSLNEKKLTIETNSPQSIIITKINGETIQISSSENKKIHLPIEENATYTITPSL